MIFHILLMVQLVKYIRREAREDVGMGKIVPEWWEYGSQSFVIEHCKSSSPFFFYLA